MKNGNIHQKMNDLHSEFSKTAGINFLLLAAVLFLFSSCEKVINIDLNNSDPRLVVEANITSQAGPFTVKLTRSGNFYDSNIFPPVTDATVTLSDNAGSSEVLHQTTDGIYQSSTITGVPGRTYNMEITNNGKQYTASSTMPLPVPIDSVVITTGTVGGGGRPVNGFRITTYFKDPEGPGNCYRLLISSNDTVAMNRTRFKLLTDKLSDGNEVSISYNTKLLSSDSITLELESIDKSTYNFYSTLGDASGEGSFFLSAPPANPVNNISNGGLGYFAAYSFVRNKYVIP